MKTLALVMATLITGSVAGTANATAPVTPDVRQQVVSFADLNLENSADAEILLGRIKSAARLVCGLRNSGPLPIDFRSRQQNCAKDAAARAIADVDARTIVVAARD
jgi:UrcA family protein